MFTNPDPDNQRASFSSRAPEHVAMADYIVVSATTWANCSSNWAS